MTNTTALRHVSPTLRGVASNDFDKLGLPFCGS